MSIRDVTDKTTTLLVHLLKRFADTNVVTSTQMTEVNCIFDYQFKYTKNLITKSSVYFTCMAEVFDLFR